MTYVFQNATAFDPYTATGVPNAMGQVFALSDTGFLAPLTVTLLSSGLQTVELVSDQYSQLPGFDAGDNVQVVFKSGEFTKILNTSTPLPGPSGEDGKSAYQTAADAGYTGTELEFNATLSDAPELVIRAENAEQAAEAAAALVDAPADEAIAAAIGGNGQTATVLNATFVRKEHLRANLADFGGVGDNSTDNLAAFNAARDALFAVGGGTIYVPRGAFRSSGEIDIYRPSSPRIDIVIEGESQWNTKILANFYGADKALIKSVDPTGVSRTSPTSPSHIQLGNVSVPAPGGGVNPVMLDILGHGESRIDSVRFGASNNTHMRIGAIQNVRMNDVVSFYGGKHFSYKDTTGITFTSTVSRTLTASAPVFNAGDVGRVISVYGSTIRAKYVISTVVDAQNATISGLDNAFDITGTGHFEPARITTVAGSNQVSANAQIFHPEDIGRVIYIQNARSGAWGPALLRATITEYVSGATVRLSTVADLSVTRTEFAVPVIDIWRPLSGGLAADNNDAKIDNLHIENYAGVGLVVQNSVFLHINKMKIHGEVTPINTRASHGHAWLDDYSGTFDGDLDGMAMGQSRIHLCNMNDLLVIPQLSTRLNRNEKVFEVETMTDPGGVAVVQAFNAYNPAAGADPYALVTDPNASPRLLFDGVTNMLGDAEEPRIYKGKGTYFTPNGEMVTKSPDGTRYKVTVANGGAVSATSL